MPALLTRIVTVPNSVSVRETIAATAAASATSAATAMARPPAPLISATKFSRCIRVGGIVDAYGGAMLRQPPRRCASDAARAAGHQRYLVAPFHHYLPALTDSP